MCGFNGRQHSHQDEREVFEPLRGRGSWLSTSRDCQACQGRARAFGTPQRDGGRRRHPALDCVLIGIIDLPAPLRGLLDQAFVARLAAEGRRSVIMQVCYALSLVVIVFVIVVSKQTVVEITEVERAIFDSTQFVFVNVVADGSLGQES